MHCNDSLVWFEAFGICYNIYSESSQGPFSNILLLPCVMEILKLWFCRTGPIYAQQQFIDRIDGGMDQLKALDLGLGGSWLVPMPLGPALLLCPGKGWVQFFCLLQLTRSRTSCTQTIRFSGPAMPQQEMGPSLPRSCPRG